MQFFALTNFAGLFLSEDLTFHPQKRDEEVKFGGHCVAEEFS